MRKNDFISVIIRTMPGREKFLDKCLFILSGQVYEYIEPIVVVQKLNEKDSLENIESIITFWKKSFNKIKLLSHTSPFDARSHSLNLGMKASTGRYYAFLDDDDKVYPIHYSNLIIRLKTSNFAWAYTDIVLATYDKNNQLRSRKTPFKRDKYSFISHLRSNYIPIHSFVIDSLRAKDVGWVDETMEKNEDYEFLLRLAFQHEPLYVENFSAEYSVRSDGTNTIMSPGCSAADAYKKRQQWIAAELELNLKKIKNFGWWIGEVDSISIENTQLLSKKFLNSKQAQKDLINIHKSICWKFIRVFKKLNWKLRGRKKKRNVIPDNDIQIAEALLKIYSSKSWQLISPFYVIESYMRRF
ncbi:glycosyltransferase [Snodgrassella alvi]|uniref:glycosyltransferase n=1 Tax=Snodgrassella alvi TaxID=1196083 RepID=UPI003519AB74